MDRNNNEHLISDMFKACQEGDLDKMKALHAKGVPLNVKYPYHNGTLIHQAIWTAKVYGRSHWYATHVPILEWLLPELRKQGFLLDVMNTQITYDDTKRSLWVAQYGDSLDLLGRSELQGKTPLETMH